MPTAVPKLDFANQYVDWLKRRVETNPRGEVVCISTPFLDAFNDGIQIHAQPHGGEWVLHDNGLTVENLLCQGMNLEVERRQALIQHACAGCGVRYSGNRLEISSSLMNFPQRMHFLLSALLSFSWLDIGDSRPGTEKIVLINNLRAPDAFAEEEEDEERGVSDKALAILRAYSDRVYLWSERNQPEFRSLWEKVA